MGAVLGFLAVSATFFWSFPDFGLGLRCCFGVFCGFSYFFLLFSGFWAGFRVLFWGFLRFQLLFSALFRIFGCCFGNFCGFSYFFLLFSRFLAGFGVLFWGFLQFQLLFPRFSQAFRMDLGAVLEILGISATQDLPAMLSTYGYCTL